MPTVKLPDGTRLNFPDGMSEEEMASAIDANFPQFASPKAQPKQPDALDQEMLKYREGKPAPERSWGEAIADSARSLTQGVLDVASLPGVGYGAVTGNYDNALLRTTRGINEAIDDQMSPAMQARRQELARKQGAAEGWREKLGVGLVETISDPALLVNTALRSVPGMAAGGAAGRVAGSVAGRLAGTATEIAPSVAGKVTQGYTVTSAAPQIVPKVAGATAVGTAAAQQGASVAADTYDEAMKVPLEVLRQDPEFQALAEQIGEVQAQKRMAADAANRAGAVATAASVASMNLVPGGSAIEKAFLPSAMRETAKAGSTLLTRPLTKGMAGGFGSKAAEIAVSGGAKGAEESLSEGFEEGAGAAAKALEMSRLGKDVNVEEEAAAAAGQAMPVGFALGGGVQTVQTLRAPRVENQPTVPVAPPVTPAATDPRSVAQKIKEAEGGPTDTGAAPAAADPAAQTRADSRLAAVDAALAEQAAVPGAAQPTANVPAAPVAQALTNPQPAIPAATDPRSQLASELAALRQRAEQQAAQQEAQRVKAEAEAAAKTASTGSNYQQKDATPVSMAGAVPNPQTVDALVNAARGTAAQYADIRNPEVYSEPVLYGIINHPNVGPEMLSMARTELARRRGTIQAPNVSTNTSITGIPGSTGTRVDSPAGSGVQGAQPTDRAGGPAALPQANTAAPGVPTGATALGNQPAAGTGTQGAAPALSNRQDGGAGRFTPVLAPAAPKALAEAQLLTLRNQHGIEAQVSQRPLTEEQQLTSHFVNTLGKTITWVEGVGGKSIPDGWVNQTGGKHIFLDVNGAKPLLETLLHEGTHALPDRIRLKLARFVLQRTAPEGQDAFLDKYRYSKLSPKNQAEEILAYVAQQVGRRPEFIQDLKTALGNKDFAEFARVLINKMREWLGRGDSQFDREFLDKYVQDVQGIHNELVKAYAEAMREQGLEPDAGVTAPMFATKQDGGRVGSVATHVLAAQRDERVVADKTRISKDEAAIIRQAAKKMGKTIGEVEEMVRDSKAAHPASDGWAQLVLTGFKVDEEGKGDLQYKTIPYSFNNGTNGDALSEGTPEYVAKVNNMAHAMLREVRGIYERAKSGDVAAQKIIAQSGWYKEMRTRLRQEFGGLGDLFADLLGATSPNTPVRTNWDNSVEALRLATQGAFDQLMPKWVEWARGVDSVNTRFRARYDDMLEKGMTKAAIDKDPEYLWLAQRASEIREFPDNLLPLKGNGKKFGFNGKNVVRALIDLWRVVKNADPDINVGGTAPKAINFSGNLIGFRARATIDVWAARMLQRLSGGLRIPSMAEGGVTGEALESGRNTLQFGFGQDVFSEAVRLIRNDLELSEDPVLRSINDDDLQALVWFIEKEVWTKGNWTSAAGEGGSFEFESDLAGVTDRDKVNEQRKIADSSVARNADQTSKAQAEVERLSGLLAGYGRIPEANATLQRNADRLADKTAKLTKDQKEEIRASNAEARDILKEEKATKGYKDLKKELDRQKNILKKPTTEQRAQMRADAIDKLGKMARTVDRFTAGISIQKGAEQGMDPTPPSDADMAQAMDDIGQAVVQGDPGATIVGLKVIASEGRYGDPERTIDLEVITTDEFDPRPMAAKVFEVAEQADQDAAFVARVLRPDEEFDPLMHRPGIELYFRDMNQAQEAARMMAEIPSIRLSKPSEFGPNFFGIGGYTVVVDGRPSASAKRGEMGKPVGMRILYLPEFEARYGMDPRLENATDSELRAIVQERADDLARFADSVLRNFEGVSFAGRFDYEVDTRFAGEYQGAIDGYTNGKPASTGGSANGKPWSGRSNRESIAAATGRLSVDGGQPGAELPGGDSGQVFSNKQGSRRTVEPDVQDGSSARTSAVRVQGTHFSKQPRTNLDGRYNGTGLKGAERTRLSLSQDPRIKERVYFYVDEGNGIRPESGVGGVAHTADLRNIYDVTGDKAGLFKSSDDNQNESNLLDAGYDGYYVPRVFNNQGVVVVLGKASRDIPVTPADYTKGTAPVAPEPPYKRGLTSKELNTIDLAAVQAVAPSAKLRTGTLQIDRAELDAAREELSSQGIELPADGPVFSNKARDLDQDIVLTFPVEGGKTAKMTVNAKTYLDQLSKREDALRMVKECLA